MQFIKKHYEKIILSIVLLGLAGAAALMPIKVGQLQSYIDELQRIYLKPSTKPLRPTDLTTNEMVLHRAETNQDFVLAGQHNTFNPVKWQKKPDGGLIKASEVGLGGVEITKITPLNLTVSLEDTRGEGENIRYQINIVNEAEKGVRKIAGVVSNTEQGRKASQFALQSVSGPPENPTSLMILLKGEKNAISISKDKPFTQVVGYAVDLKSDLFKVDRKGLRVKDQITLGEETYNIVAIGPDEVVLSAKSNAKQTTLKYNAGAAK